MTKFNCNTLAKPIKHLTANEAYMAGEITSQNYAKGIKDTYALYSSGEIIKLKGKKS